MFNTTNLGYSTRSAFVSTPHSFSIQPQLIPQPSTTAQPLAKLNEIQFTSESSQPTTSPASVAANNSHSDCHLLSIQHNSRAQIKCSLPLSNALASNQPKSRCHLSNPHEGHNVDGSANGSNQDTAALNANRAPTH